MHLYDSTLTPHEPVTSQVGLAARPSLARSVGDRRYLSYAEGGILHLVELSSTNTIVAIAEPSAPGAPSPASASLVSTGVAAPALIGAWEVSDSGCWMTRADEELAFSVDVLDDDCQGVRLAAQGGGAVATYVSRAAPVGRIVRLGGTGADEPVDLGPADEVRVLTTGAEIVVALRSDQAVTVLRGASLDDLAPVAIDVPALGRISAFELARAGPTSAALFVLYGSGELWVLSVC